MSQIVPATVGLCVCWIEGFNIVADFLTSMEAGIAAIELKAICHKHSLPIKGPHADVLKRIVDHYSSIYLARTGQQHMNVVVLLEKYSPPMSLA